MSTSTSENKPGSLTLGGAVSLGTGVMIGAGIFALTGQVAELAGDLFPLALFAAALVVATSAYSYVKLSNSMPSSGGIAMFLKEEYGLGVATGVFSLFMYVSMVINESLVARTFGAYTLQIIDLGSPTFWVPALGILLLAIAFGVNLSGNKIVQIAAGSMAAVKVGGLAVLAIGGLAFADWANLTNGSSGSEESTPPKPGSSPRWRCRSWPTRASPRSPTAAARSSTPTARGPGDHHCIGPVHSAVSRPCRCCRSQPQGPRHHCFTGLRAGRGRPAGLRGTPESGSPSALPSSRPHRG